MGDAGEGLIDQDSRIQERMEELERERATRRANGRARSRAGARARVAAPGADRARGTARRDRPRAAPRADRAGDRRDRSPHGRGECRTAPERRSPVPRRDQAPLQPLRPVARVSRLGVAAASVSTFRGRAGVPAPSAPGCRGAGPGGRRSAASCARPLGLEAVPRLALVAARQPVERQPASHRGVRHLRSVARPRRRAGCLSLRAPSGTSSSCAASSSADAWRRLATDGGRSLLVVLTSIHWREAWKYGERAFRYCQHDLGHAIAAVAYRREHRRLQRDACSRPGRRRGSRRSPASIATRTSWTPSARSPAACSR